MEGQITEWKETWRDDRLKTIRAFANASTGTLKIERHDDGEMVGLCHIRRLLVFLFISLFALVPRHTLAGQTARQADAAPPKRVVSQTVGTDDILLALAGPSQIAALSHLAHDPLYAPDAELAKRYPKLKGSSAEDILRFKPDLVLMAAFSPPDSVSILKKSGVRLYILDKYETLEDVYASLRQLGDLLGRRQRAEDVIASCRSRVSSLANVLKGEKPVRVLSAGVYPYISGSNTSFQDLCDHAGAVNVAAEAGINGVAPILPEKLLTWKIDFLVGPTEHRPNEAGPQLIDRMRDIAPFRFLQAYKQGRVVEIPGALFASTSHHRITAYEILAHALHPERFKDAVPKAAKPVVTGSDV
ncbi:MAG: ABC transporter substrate-binding protein [Holophagales bacterium]|nr:ABC transporter substrate-binding protein [Holophagales bacterium]